MADQWTNQTATTGSTFNSNRAASSLGMRLYVHVMKVPFRSTCPFMTEPKHCENVAKMTQRRGYSAFSTQLMYYSTLRAKQPSPATVPRFFNSQYMCV